jgi:hypothetical protein
MPMPSCADYIGVVCSRNYLLRGIVAMRACNPVRAQEAACLALERF